MMTSSLNLSANELSSLLRQVCKATYTAQHDYITIRETVMWMEINGFDGLRALLGDFTDSQTCPRKSSFGSNPLQWSLGGESLIPIAHMAGDLMLAESQDTEIIQMNIDNVKNPSSVLLEMQRFMEAGLTAQLFVEGQIFALCDGQRLQIFQSPDNWPRIAKNVQIRAGQAVEIKCQPVMSLADIQRRTNHIYHKGLLISSELYEALTARAALCLVPSTEESRKGAGE